MKYFVHQGMESFFYLSWLEAMESLNEIVFFLISKFIDVYPINWFYWQYFMEKIIVLSITWTFQKYNIESISNSTNKKKSR